MKCQKFVALLLSCLMILETPFVSQAAGFLSDPNEKSVENSPSSFNNSGNNTTKDALSSLDNSNYNINEDNTPSSSNSNAETGEDPLSSSNGSNQDSAEENTSSLDNLNSEGSRNNLPSLPGTGDEASKDNLPSSDGPDNEGSEDDLPSLPDSSDEISKDNVTPSIDSIEDFSSAEQKLVADLRVLLNHDTYKLNTESKLQLTAAVFDAKKTKIPSDSVEVYWVSDSPDVASVSDQGVVKTLKAGHAVITVTAAVKTAKETHIGTASCTLTVKNRIFLNKKALTLYTSQTEQLKATAFPQSTIRWKSSNKKIATVNSNGKITAKKAGTVTIKATANNASAVCRLKIKASSLKLGSNPTVYLDNPITLKVSAVPKNTVTFKTSNNKIATVNSAGKVTPKKTGTVTITASCNGIKKSCKITVKKPTVQINKKSLVLFSQNNYALNAKAHPAKKLTYRSSNPEIATVDENGKITGKKKGSVTITASVPGAKTSCKVKILKNEYKLSRTSQTLMKGKSATIYLRNASNPVSFKLTDQSVAELSSSGNGCTITARKPGTATLHAYYKVYHNDEWVTCKRSCTIKVIGSGVIQQQAAVAVKATRKLTLKNIKRSGVHIKKTTWKSSNPKIASVNRKTGAVTGKNTGTAKITAMVYYSDGTSKEYDTSIKVSNPKTKNNCTVISLGKTRKISLSGLTSYSTVSWTSKDNSLASISPNGTIQAGYTSGKTTINIRVDGKTIKHTVHITNPALTKTNATLSPGKKTKIKLSGVSSKSRITYKSQKTSIATVSKSGVVTGRGSGTTRITVTADGNHFTFEVSVIAKRALNACKKGYNIMYSSTYSQARRMSHGFYDCSSLVFRSYGCDSGLLGGSPTWAPTAAAMASHLENTGKVISYHGISADKLLPGDLIFYSSPRSNGRYKNIYHVSMYYGNNHRLEKPLRYYYPESNIVMIARPLR